MIVASTTPILMVIPFLFCTGIFGTIFNFAKGVIGSVIGGKKATTPSTNYQNLYQQSQQQVYNLQAQATQKKQMIWIPIAMIGGIGFLAIFLLKK